MGEVLYWFFFQGIASDLEKGLSVCIDFNFWDTNIRLGDGSREELAYISSGGSSRHDVCGLFRGLGIIMCFAYHKWDEFGYLYNSRFVPPFFNSC